MKKTTIKLSQINWCTGSGEMINYTHSVSLLILIFMIKLMNEKS